MSEMVQDMSKVTIDDYLEVAYGLSNGVTLDDFSEMKRNTLSMPLSDP